MEKSRGVRETIPDVTIQQDNATKNCSSSAEMISDDLNTDLPEADK
jgi:hypothetical protein